MPIFGFEIVLIFAIYYYSVLSFVVVVAGSDTSPRDFGDQNGLYKYCKINKKMNTGNPLLKAIIGIKFCVGKQGGY